MASPRKKKMAEYMIDDLLAIAKNRLSHSILVLI